MKHNAPQLQKWQKNRLIYGDCTWPDTCQFIKEQQIERCSGRCRSNIPVVINGDIIDGPSAEAALMASGADAVMVPCHNRQPWPGAS